MFAQFQESFVTKFDDAFTAYLYRVTLDGTCASSGDSESPTGWFAIIGRNIITEDGFGFVTRERFSTVNEAMVEYAERENTYADWSHECESSCYVCGSHNHCGCECGYYHPTTEDHMTCGHCGRSWVESIHPAPSARCPYEHDHEYSEDED